MAAWLREYAAEAAEGGVDPAEILAGFDTRETVYAETCRRLIANFVAEAGAPPS